MYGESIFRFKFRLGKKINDLTEEQNQKEN